MTRSVEPGRPVVLDDGQGGLHLVRVPKPDQTVEVDSIGVLSGSLFGEAELGGQLKLGRRTVRVLPVTPELAFETLKRGAQVIRPIDASRIAHACAVGPGSTVVEGGVGSGALTAYLAFLVGDDGHVHGYDRREDHIGTARTNVERLDLDERVTWHETDLAEARHEADAFLVDVPEPEAIVPAAEASLVPGGRVAFFSPLVSQVEAVHEALGEHAFDEPRTLEQLARDWVVHDRGARPDFEMLGHTGFLTFATRVL